MKLLLGTEFNNLDLGVPLCFGDIEGWEYVKKTVSVMENRKVKYSLQICKDWLLHKYVQS